MNPRYRLEVLAPGEETSVLQAEIADSGAQSILVGDWVRAGEHTLRVVSREHRFERDADGTVQVLRLYTEAPEQAGLGNIGATLGDLGKRAREKAQRLVGETRERSAEIVEEYRPVVGELLEKRLGGLARDTLSDDDALEAALRGIYQVLPAAVRIALREDVFVRSCMKHRERFLPPR